MVLLLLAPRAAAACSLRPTTDRAAFWQTVLLIGYSLGAISVLAALGSVLLLWRSPTRPVRAGLVPTALVALAIVQPAWWVPIYNGDCGMNRHMFGLLVALISVTLAGLEFFRLRRIARASG